MAGPQVSEDVIFETDEGPAVRSRSVRFTRRFCAAHRLATDPGKCRNLHGHNYRVNIVVTAATLNGQGFIVPFDHIKDVIDSNDHRLILDRDDPLLGALGDLDLAIRVTMGPPSTERLAQALADEIIEVCDQSSEVSVEVWLQETEGIEAYAFSRTAS